MTLPRELGPLRHELERAGVTYRKLDHWTSLGLLGGSNHHPGSGTARSWTTAQLQLAVWLGRLTRAGLTLKAAAEYMRGERDGLPHLLVKATSSQYLGAQPGEEGNHV